MSRSSGWTSSTEGLADPVVRAVAEEPLDRDALVHDPAVAVDDHEEVRGVLDQGAEARFAVGQRVGQLAEPAVLAVESPRGAVERGDQQGREQDRDRGRDQEDIAPCGGDVGVDGGRVLVDLVGGDDLAVRTGDREVDLQQPVGEAVLELVLGCRGVRDVVRDLAGEGFLQVGIDIEALAAQRRQVGEQHGAVRTPDLDAEEVARPDQPFELGIDLPAAGAVGGAHRALGQDRVDEGADDRFGAAHGLVGGRIADVVGDDLRREQGGAQHRADHRRDEDRARSQPVRQSDAASAVWSVVRSGIGQARRSVWHAAPAPGCRLSAP